MTDQKRLTEASDYATMSPSIIEILSIARLVLAGEAEGGGKEVEKTKGGEN